jgi:colicin import membrane protein
MWGKTELRLSCYTCGTVKYGDATIRQALEVQFARWTRQQNEDAAFQASVEKERAERLAQEAEAARERKERRARNAEAARLRAEQEAREELERKAQEKARREQERE